MSSASCPSDGATGRGITHHDVDAGPSRAVPVMTSLR
jgi:hypothetical protein